VLLVGCAHKDTELADWPGNIRQCTTEFSNDKQLQSLECGEDNIGPRVFQFHHPVYKDVLVGINRHSLSTNLKDDEDRVQTRVIIKQTKAWYSKERKQLYITTHGKTKRALDVSMWPPNTYCGILSFTPITIDRDAGYCSHTLREAITLLKKLNSG
jgi:hypothetical protein